MHRAPALVLGFLLLLRAMSSLAQDAAGPASPAQTADDATAMSAATSPQQPNLMFNFRDAPWPQVFGFFAEAADLTLDLTDTPEGNFNYIDDRPRSLPEALDVLNGYLLPRGYVTLRRDEFLVVLSTDNPMVPNLIPTVPAEQLHEYGDNELLRIVVTMQGLDPSNVAEQLSGLLGKFGSATPVDASEALVLQGFGRSLRETVKLLSSAVIPPADDELVFRSFPLRYIAAADAERQIQNLFGLLSSPYLAAQTRRSEWERRREGGRDNDDDNARSRGPTPLVQDVAMNLRVSALRSTNSLLVTATPAAVTLIEGILTSIDVRPDGAVAIYDDSTPSLKIYKVGEADEDDVAETINAVVPGVVINQDDRHDAIHVLASPAEHREVEELIRILDGGGAGGGLEVVRLTRNDPVQMSVLLSSLFENEDRDERPVITPEPRNASLMIRATSSQMAEIKHALAAYGETFTLSPVESTSRRFRRLRLQSADDTARIARAVESLLRDDSDFDNPIRVVIPADQPLNPVGGDSPEVRRREIQLEPEPDDVTTEQHVPSYETVSTFVGEVVGSDAPGQTSRTPRVTIEVHGSDLIIYSNDDVALDYVEETIRELVRQMPSRTQWTVFYLRAAAAQEAALSLVDLLQKDAYPAALGVGPDDVLADLGQQTMRIVPDARTNALFVSGPDDQVEAASRFLTLLDTTDLPESLRDRVPRAIPVEHANVIAVAEMIRELYKDFMEDPNAARSDRRGNNQDEEDRQIRLSQTASQAPGLRPPGIRLTMAVDAEARELLVSCNEQMFEQIRQLVKERDAAALASRPAGRVIRVREVGASYLGAVLSGMSPRITMTTPGGASVQVPRESGGSLSGGSTRRDEVRQSNEDAPRRESSPRDERSVPRQPPQTDPRERDTGRREPEPDRSRRN